MNYFEFERAFRDYPVFSVKDIRKRYHGFDNRRLVEWQQKGYILKIRRGYYCFPEWKDELHFPYYAANRIYSPSYISMESALSYYNLIPEGVFTTTSVTTLNTSGYNTCIGNFAFRHIKPELFFGYRLFGDKVFKFKMAEPEKVILDYFYLKKFKTIDEVEEMRFNTLITKEIMNFEKFDRYQRVFNSKMLNKRISWFKKMIHA